MTTAPVSSIVTDMEDNDKKDTTERGPNKHKEYRCNSEDKCNHEQQHDHESESESD